MHLDAQADIWAEEFGLNAMIDTAMSVGSRLSRSAPAEVRAKFIARQKALIDTIVRHAYAEGFYNGGMSRADYEEKRRG